LLDRALGEKWAAIRSAREQVTEAIEPLRREKIVRSSLEADIKIGLDPDLAKILRSVDFAEICIVSRATVLDSYDNEIEKLPYSPNGIGIAVAPSSDHKCGRCWRLLPEVTEDGALCDRCEDVLKG
jgi:isoleucyl-tRNA synthetase